MKRKTRLRYLYLIDPAQLQTWLEDESLRGWRLEQVWREWGKFRRAEPRRVRYRMEPDITTLSTTDGDIAERDQLYADMGWQRVAGRTLAGLILSESIRRENLQDDCGVQVLYRSREGSVKKV